MAGEAIKLPTCSQYNIFHEFDPVAYRVEPLIDPRFAGVDPVGLQRFDKSLPIKKNKELSRCCSWCS